MLTFAPMKAARRAFAFVAILAIAFGSLWPLISMAKPHSPALPNFVCSQAEPAHSPAPGGGEESLHCSLCLVSCDVALPSMPAAQAWIALQEAGAVGPAGRRFSPRFAARPPPSHAPPSRP